MGGNPRAVAAGIAIKRPPIMNASLVVTANHAGYVLTKARVGGIRVVDMLSGEQLPWIC
jgi:hypothetical protein